MAPRGKAKRKDGSMKRTLTSAAAAAFCFSFLLGGIARAQEEKTPASEETTWTVVRVVETARPETATFKGLFWPPIVTREKAPEGFRWLVVVAELKPPEPKEKLKVSAVHLVDNSSKEHTVFALSYYKEPWHFESVADFPAGVSSATDQATWGKDRGEAELELAINEGKEGLVALLFRVPADAQGFRLQLNDGPFVAVPLEEPQASKETSRQ